MVLTEFIKLINNEYCEEKFVPLVKEPFMYNEIRNIAAEARVENTDLNILYILSQICIIIYKS